MQLHPEHLCERHGSKNGEMGVGFAVVGGHSSFADLIELPGSTLPPMTFTWAKNVVPYLSP